MSGKQPQTTSTITCPNCQSEISSRAIVCKFCGTLIKQISGSATKTMIINRPEENPLPDDDISTPGGTSRFSEGSLLYFSVERVNSPIARYVRIDPFVIGREETAKLNNEDLNLTPYNAADRGVSRRHAQVYFLNGKVYIEDLKSSNGTFLNGDELEPGKPYQLRDGDELMLGRMLVWVNF
ncbi:MAG: FHA domain-containing protein [Chloroflexota bacterium]